MAHSLPACRVNVVDERLLQMGQFASARAIGPVLERGKGNGLVSFMP